MNNSGQMTFAKIINQEELQKEIANGYVIRRRHPGRDLFVHNYTAKTQYDDHWNAVTRACRGLILDMNGAVVARPFEKFFNLDRHPPMDLPAEPFEVWEKLDGSLIIVARHEGELVVATRGSFESEQAETARRLLNEKYDASVIEEGKTYLFEVVYPGNRIVVDYGEEEHLTLLAVRDTPTGEYIPCDDLGFRRPRRFVEECAPHALYDLVEDNAEGYVVCFRSGMRAKVKFPDYVRLHQIRTQLSTKNIWRHLRSGHPLEELLLEVPDDLRPWAKEEGMRLKNAYAELAGKATGEVERLTVGQPLQYAEDRKATAIRFKEEGTLPVGLLFQLLLGQKWQDVLWKRIEPEFRTPRGDLLEAE